MLFARKCLDWKIIVLTETRQTQTKNTMFSFHVWNLGCYGHESRRGLCKEGVWEAKEEEMNTVQHIIDVILDQI